MELIISIVALLVSIASLFLEVRVYKDRSSASKLARTADNKRVFKDPKRWGFTLGSGDDIIVKYGYVPKDQPWNA